MSITRRARPNLLEQSFTYLDGVLKNSGDRLQCLLCDDDIMHILTTIYSQTQLLAHRVVLVDSLQNVASRFLMKHLHCIVMCRPTDKSVNFLTKELAAGNFKTYRVYLSNLVDMDVIQKIANADMFDIVETVEEVFLDVTATSDNAATVTLAPPSAPQPSAPDDFIDVAPPARAELKHENPVSWAQWTPESLSRVASAIIATMLMMNRRPAIRYRKGNQVAERLAAELAARMKTVHQSFPDLKAKECVLVIADRLDDPVTPLLTQWTYEAMIHEIIGFQRGSEVNLEGDCGGDKDKQRENTHVLTAQSDPFFAQHRYSDYGQLCVAVSELVETYKAMNNLDRTTATIEDIKNFMSNFPEAKKQSSQVTRHAAILGHLVDEVNARNLTKLSVLEQEMVASSSVTEHSKTVLELVRHPKTDIDDALRIAILYHLKYEKNASNITAQLKTEIELRGCPKQKVALIDKVAEVAGSNYRLHELYRTSTGSIFKAAVSSIAQFGSEVQNVLTQHQPLLKKIVNRAYNGTLSEKDYPVQAVHGSPLQATQAVSQRAKDILVFMVGGATFEEQLLLNNINKGLVDNNVETLMNIGQGVGKVVGGLMGSNDAPPPATSDAEPQTAKIEANVVLLSTTVLNSKIFLKCLESM